MDEGTPRKFGHFPPPDESGDDDLAQARALRDWWHGVLRQAQGVHIYGVLLLLPSDKETAQYLTESGAELDLISGDNCLIMLLTADTISAQAQGNDAGLHTLTTQHVAQGFSVQFADILGVALDKFPCLVLFEDVRSPRHMVVSLRDMDAAEIAETMKAVFSTINAAVEDGKKPLDVLEAQRSREKFLKAGKSIIGVIKTVAEKTFEKVVGAVTDAALARAGLS